MRIRLTREIHTSHLILDHGEVGEIIDWRDYEGNGLPTHFEVLFYGRPGTFDILVQDLEKF